MRDKVSYSREYHWARAPKVWGTLAKIALWAFVIGVIVGAQLF